MDRDNESWIIETGAQVIEKASSLGRAALSPIEKLINCLWVADYGMNNAGDLETSRDLDATFQRDAAKLAAKLKLLYTYESFSLTPEELEQQYFDRFDKICEELKNAYALKK